MCRLTDHLKQKHFSRGEGDTVPRKESSSRIILCSSAEQFILQHTDNLPQWHEPPHKLQWHMSTLTYIQFPALHKPGVNSWLKIVLLNPSLPSQPCLQSHHKTESLPHPPGLPTQYCLGNWLFKTFRLWECCTFRILLTLTATWAHSRETGSFSSKIFSSSSNNDSNAVSIWETCATKVHCRTAPTIKCKPPLKTHLWRG